MTGDEVLKKTMSLLTMSQKKDNESFFDNKYFIREKHRILEFPFKVVWRQGSLCLCCCRSVAKLCPILHHLLEFARVHIHWIGDAIQPSYLCRPLLLPWVFPSIRVFCNELTLCIKWPGIGISASASVLSMNIQGWFPLGLTGLISLLFKGLLCVYSASQMLKG